MAGKRVGMACRECGAMVSGAARREPRAWVPIEVGCTDWYMYPVEPDAGERPALPGSGLAATRRPMAPGAGAWVKRPVGD